MSTKIYEKDAPDLLAALDGLATILTDTEIADAVGVNRNTVCRWRNRIRTIDWWGHGWLIMRLYHRKEREILRAAK